MAAHDEYDDDPLGAGESYSQLLFTDDDVVTLDIPGCFNLFSPPKMLCFGDYAKECDDNASGAAKICGVTCSDSPISPPLSSTTTNNTTNNIKKKRNRLGKDQSSMVWNASGGGGGGGVAGAGAAGGGNQKNCKKAKAKNSTVSGHAKVKKEKLGERVTALQQLVSPFGKTDTASVLHEAMGYIRFLHDQVQVLSSPYLQRPSSSAHRHEGKENWQGEPQKELRSRGLCLVPVELTSHVADTNGADFWSPAPVNNVLSNQ